jgi:proline dehydrogenase
MVQQMSIDEEVGPELWWPAWRALPPVAPVASGSAAAARLFPLVPRRIARALSARYIAGVTFEDAVGVATQLHARGLLVTLDVLGESVRTKVEAASYADYYLNALAALLQAGLQPHVSVKPSALGSLIDWRLCEYHVACIAKAAATCGGLVCLDMERSHTIDGTLELYRRLQNRQLGNVSMAVQARLHRTCNDLRSLAPIRPHVRICKGVYPEPARIAYTDPEAIRRNYVFCLDTLLECGGYAAIATHDEALIVSSLERLSRQNRSPETYEFQMLLGVRQDLAEALVAAGHSVRVYVPYGEDWHQYAARRFRESPQILGHVMRAQVHSAAARFLHRRTGAEGIPELDLVTDRARDTSQSPLSDSRSLARSAQEQGKNDAFTAVKRLTGLVGLDDKARLGESRSTAATSSPRHVPTQRRMPT